MRWMRIVVAVAGAGLLAAPVAAQTTLSVGVAPYVGYMHLGNLISGPLGTSLGAIDGFAFGGRADLALTPNIALVGNLGYTSGDMTFGIPLVGGVTIGQRSALMYDLGVRYQAPLGSGRIVPFVEGGLGAMRQKVSTGPISVTATDLAWHAGLGASVQLAPQVALHLIASDYISKFNPGDQAGLDLSTDAIHNFAVTVGVRLGLGL